MAWDRIIESWALVIFIRSKDINLLMIESGLAEVYRGKSPKGFDIEPYRQTETEAKAAKRGCGHRAINTFHQGTGGR